MMDVNALQIKVLGVLLYAPTDKAKHLISSDFNRASGYIMNNPA